MPQTDYVDDLAYTFGPMGQVPTHKEVWLRQTKIITQKDHKLFIRPLNCS